MVAIVIAEIIAVTIEGAPSLRGERPLARAKCRSKAFSRTKDENKDEEERNAQSCAIRTGYQRRYIVDE
jgi:hypothetical protein